MGSSGHAHSIFSQKLDRAVFGTYFLGAVVPMLALALVAHRYAIPAFDDDSNGTLGMVGFIVGVGVLSLAAFFALRRLIRTAIARMDSDNERLATVLAASRNLSSALHTHAVAETAAGAAASLTGAEAVFVLLEMGPEKPLSLFESSANASAELYEKCRASLEELAESAFSSGEPALLAGGAAGGPVAAASIPLVVSKGPRGVIALVDTRSGASFAPEQVDAVATLAGFTSVAFQNADLQDSQRNFFAHVTDILVTALDAQLDRGDARAGHPSRIAAIANSIGRELQLDDEQLQRLHFAALLHDIGYLKLDRALHYDAAQCKSHPVLGHRLLSRIRLWEDVAPIVLYHHEWWDGSGYPENRSGSEIPIESRIIAAADMLDKLTHEDYESPPIPVSEAIERLSAGSGRQFDPQIIDTLREIVSRGALVA